MAVTGTTLSSAIGIVDTSIVVGSASGFAAGMTITIDQETLRVQQGYVAGGTTIPVLRGQDGSVTSAHPVSAKVIVELASDLSYIAPAQVSTQRPTVQASDVNSYSASGAITLPAPGRNGQAYLNGTGALAMTLANPTLDMDQSRLLIVGNGKAAHTVTYTAGLGNGGGTLDVGTAASGNQCSFELVAAGGFWVYIGIPSATGAANAFTWA